MYAYGCRSGELAQTQLHNHSTTDTTEAMDPSMHGKVLQCSHKPLGRSRCEQGEWKGIVQWIVYSKAVKYRKIKVLGGKHIEDKVIQDNLPAIKLPQVASPRSREKDRN